MRARQTKEKELNFFSLPHARTYINAHVYVCFWRATVALLFLPARLNNSYEEPWEEYIPRAASSFGAWFLSFFFPGEWPIARGTLNKKKKKHKRQQQQKKKVIIMRENQERKQVKEKAKGI